MNVDTTFAEKKRQKQLKFERKLLGDLSLNTMRKSVLSSFGKLRIPDEGLEEACYDVAIEAYLNGACASRFYKYKESIERVQDRCRHELEHFADTLYHFWLYWDYSRENLSEADVMKASEAFVFLWWREGYQRGVQRQKLRLH